MNDIIFFEYDNPKTVRKGEIWDRRPLIIVLGKRGRRTLGLSLHWVPILFRLKLIKFIRNLKKSGASTKKITRITYNLLKGNRKLRPALQGIRLYINRRMKKVIYIPEKEIGRLMLIKPKYFAKKTKKR